MFVVATIRMHMTENQVYDLDQGTLDGVIISKLDYQTLMSEFESHWVPNSFGFVTHLSKMLSKLLYDLDQNCVCWYFSK